ncbi:hypothetical protein HPP92_013372 [Vanilla planifolia]|uniref:Uncharacterized protein n=1 Tax=Vanilla planifolia TaxID=51239 RepID=A0A835R2A0_VANPL|nr:hypothetical protein HPP92_013372 [Vanilla planifolia]
MGGSSSIRLGKFLDRWTGWKKGGSSRLGKFLDRWTGPPKQLNRTRSVLTSRWRRRRRNWTEPGSVHGWWSIKANRGRSAQAFAREWAIRAS